MHYPEDDAAHMFFYTCVTDPKNVGLIFTVR